MSDSDTTQWATTAGTMRLESQPIRGRMAERDAERMLDPRSTPHVPLRVLARAQAEGFTEALEPPLLR